jgi:hypothetical protein
MEMEVIILGKRVRLRNTNTPCFLSNAEPTSKKKKRKQDECFEGGKQRVGRG